MPPKVLKQIVFPIESTGEFLEKIDKENAKICGKPVLVPTELFIKFTLNSDGHVPELVRTMRLHRAELQDTWC